MHRYEALNQLFYVSLQHKLDYFVLIELLTCEFV